jgi:outer membrane lipoprotein-sorting protein
LGGGIYSSASLTLNNSTVSNNSEKRDIKAESLFKTSDFKLGKKEKLGDKEVLVLEFKVEVKTDREVVPGSAVIWLDPKTHLPLKHVFTADAPNRRVVITQTYSSLRIDEKIDAKLFELPK